MRSHCASEGFDICKMKGRIFPFDTKLQINIAKEQLKNDISKIAIECAEKIIKAEIDEKKHKAIFDDALKELK